MRSLECARAPGSIHEDLLVARDGLLLKLGGTLRVLHQRSHSLTDVHAVEMLLAEARVLGELTEIEAGDSFGPIAGVLVKAVSDNLGNGIEVILGLLEDRRVFFPELLGVARAPLEVLALNLVEKLLDRAVRLLVFLEKFVEISQHLRELRINPVAVLELGDER